MLECLKNTVLGNQQGKDITVLPSTTMVLEPVGLSNSKCGGSY